MATTEQVRQHYAGKDLAARLLAAAGAGDGPVTVDALAPYDELHAGGATSTAALLDLLGLAPGTTLLDVGSGLGFKGAAAGTPAHPASEPWETFLRKLQGEVTCPPP